MAGLSLLSTWVAIEIEYVEDGLEMLGDTGLKPFDLFFASIPYRFYILLSLVLVPLLALTQRDFGPMLHAERKRLREPLSPGSPCAYLVRPEQHDRVDPQSFGP